MSTNSDVIDAFAAWMTGRGLAAGTIRRRRSSLGTFVRWIHPMAFADVDAEMIETWLAEYRAPRTRHAYLGDVAALYAWGVRRKVLAVNPTVDVDGVRVPKGLPRPVPAELVGQLVDAADGWLRVAVALAAYGGLRRAEIAAMTTDDINVAGRLIAVRNGKGGKDRMVPMHPALLVVLGSVRKGRVVPRSPDRIGSAIAAHLRAHGVDCTAHQLRHTFGTELARASRGNIVLIGRMMGHASPSTTMNYVGWSGEGSEDVGRMFGDHPPPAA
jgi:integrase